MILSLGTLQPYKYTCTYTKVKCHHHPLHTSSYCRVSVYEQMTEQEVSGFCGYPFYCGFLMPFLYLAHYRKSTLKYFVVIFKVHSLEIVHCGFVGRMQLIYSTWSYHGNHLATLLSWNSPKGVLQFQWVHTSDRRAYQCSMYSCDRLLTWYIFGICMVHFCLDKTCYLFIVGCSKHNGLVYRELHHFHSKIQIHAQLDCLLPQTSTEWIVGSPIKSWALTSFCFGMTSQHLGQVQLCLSHTEWNVSSPSGQNTFVKVTDE